MSNQSERYFDWREKQARKHRTMTMAEYRGWCRVGDILSHPSASNSMSGGLTIQFGTVEDHIMGKVENFEQPPVLTDTLAN